MSESVRMHRRYRARRGWIVSALLLGAAIMGVGFIATLPQRKEEKPPLAIPPENVEYVIIQPIAQYPDQLTLTAVVEPALVVRVAAEVPSQIARYGAESPEEADAPDPAAVEALDEGDYVVAGQPIVLLEQSLFQARYDRALAQYEYDEREYQRLLGLFERGATSKTEVDDTRTRRSVSLAALNEARHDLDRTIIHAPIAGTLNRLPKEVGEYVSPGDEVAEIVQVDTVKAVVAVPERDIHYLELGEPAAVQLRGQDERVINGRITYISALAETGARTTRLEITVDNSERLVRSGQIVRAHLTRRVLEDVILIPLDAVIPLERGYVVYVVEDGHAARREVELGLIEGRRVQVTSGLAADDQLIVSGQRYVGPGEAVNATLRQEDAP